MLWVYALVAAFPTVRDGVTFDELKAAWSGNGQALVMSESLTGIEGCLWRRGRLRGGKTVPAEGLTSALWGNRPAWGIVSLRRTYPKLKVLELTVSRPSRKEFDLKNIR